MRGVKFLNSSTLTGGTVLFSPLLFAVVTLLIGHICSIHLRSEPFRNVSERGFPQIRVELSNEFSSPILKRGLR